MDFKTNDTGRLVFVFEIMWFCLLRFLKNWTLPLAMLTGGVGFPVFIHLSFLTPCLIFTMLLLTFCKVPFHDLRFKRVHGWLLLVQLGGAVLVYLMLSPLNLLAAEGAFICVIAPTATAAAVITDKLGGSAASLTSYTLLSNVGTAIAAPLLFPLVHPLGEHIGFWTAFLIILQKVFPLLICPFVVAMLLRRFLPTVHRQLTRYNEAAFYLWAIALVVVMAQTVNTLVTEPEDGMTEIWIALAALAVCCVQFFVGKKIGGRYHERISGGQSLGQKNTILAIWMAHATMSPISAVGAGSYVVWQNIINSWQLWKQRKNEEAGRIDPLRKET